MNWCKFYSQFDDKLYVRAKLKNSLRAVVMYNNNIVSQRFIKCHNKLRDSKVIKSSRQFALELEFLPQSLSEILNGRRDVTIDLIRKTVELYRFNPTFLFTGIGDMFMPKDPLSIEAEILPEPVIVKDDAEKILTEIAELKNLIEMQSQLLNDLQLNKH